MIETKSDSVAAPHGLNTRSYGLTRMILIDSFSRGRIVEMPLHGGSVITGRNGQGKTTLLKLVPLFHGESPSRIVQKTSGRESFMQHYLPNTTSYIVFEYVREPGDYCLAVHHADPDGVHLQHRFIHHPYAQELFVGEEGRMIDAQSLGQHVRLKKISVSPLISTQVAYRNILHNTPQKGTKEREYAASYSFVPPHYRLAGVERIISGMFSRQTDFDDLQNIVVRSLQGGDGEVNLLADRNQAERWIQDKRAYEAAMDAAGHYDLAKVQYDANAIAVQSILHAGARFNAYEQFATDQLAQIAEKIAACETQLAIIETKDKEDLDDVRDNIRTTGDRVKSTEALSEKYAQQKAEHECSDIESVAAETDRIPEYLARIDQLTDRRTTLEGSADQIRAAINEQRERVQSSLYDLLSTIRSELDAAREAIRGKRDLAEAEAEKQREAMRERQEGEREALTSEITELSVAERLIREQAGNPVPSPEIQRDVDETQAALEAARVEEVTARRAESEAEAGYQNSVREHEATERAVRTADACMEQAKRDLDRATRFVEGPEGSLLNMLRKDEAPNADRVARLLTEDALLSVELSPRLVDEGSSLFGYDLDTGRLPVNPHADLASARAQLRLASEARDEAEVARADALEHRGATNKARTAFEQARDVARHRLGMAEKATLSATGDHQRTVNARIAYIETLRAQGASKIAAAVEALGAAKQRLADLRAVQTEDRERLKQAHDAARREWERQDEALQSGAQEREAALQRNTESHLSSLKEDLDRQLSEGGVDPDTIREIQNQIDDLKKLHRKLSSRLREVEIWRQWRENAPQEEAVRQALLIQLRASWAAQTAEADKLLRQINEKKKGFEAERSKLRASEHVLNQDLSTVLVRRERIGELSLGAFPGPSSWRSHDDIRQVIVELGKAETELTKTQRSLDAELSRLDDVFRAYPTSQVCEFRTSGRYDAAGRHRLDGYRDWYENTHQETQRLLISQANGIAGTIRGFYRQLKEFEGATRSFNAGLQRHLGDATTFDGVEGLEIRVVSKVAELDYWDRVETVTDIANRWLNSGADGSMPDEAFSQALASLIDIWRQSGSIKTDLRNLIRIEGEVTEKGQRRRFNNAKQLENVSSTGLSYLILVSIFVAFLNRMRQGAPTIMTWPLDELRDIDQENTAKLVSLLANNKIELVCAFPDPDPGVMVHFAHRFMMDSERRLVSVRLPSEGGSDVR